MPVWRRFVSRCVPFALIAWAVLSAVGSQGEAEAPGASAFYQNPIKLEHEWPGYGTGDPFILRWNGRYYLYPSTRTHGGGNIGVKVWVSEDLVHWEYAGYASTDPVTYNAYAPEVVYWNGTFYMYTSPNGQGHYVLTSDSPTGPFVARTGNLGLSIDGSVFIDDDGTWYFTHAGFRGIRGYAMKDPFTVGSPRILEADLGGWTEGPMITKRGGYYFLTYSGNHLRSAGYRVHYAVSASGPLGPYAEGENNPLLISTDEVFHGLGHNSVVLGPDLDSYYIAYHNILNRLGDHIRELNIDRLVFNGRKMAVLGPTRFPQAAPAMPAFYTWVDEDGIEGRWHQGRLAGYQALTSAAEAGDQFTAEFNLQLATAPRCPSPEGAGEVGALFSYVDERNFSAVIIETCAKTLRVVEVDGGVWRTLTTVPLLKELDFTRLHSIRLVRADKRLEIFVDNLLAAELEVNRPAGGKIGYIFKNATPIFRFTAFSHEAAGSSDRRAPKVVPGSIEAVHYRSAFRESAGEQSGGQGGGRGQSEAAPGHAVRRIYDEAAGVYAVDLGEGETLEYVINVEKDGLYAVDVAAAAGSGGFDGSVSGGALVELRMDGIAVLNAAVPQAPDPAAGWFKVPLGRMQLASGLHTLSVTLKQGRLQMKRFDLYRVSGEPYSLFEPLTERLPEGWRQYGEGEWRAGESGLKLSSPRDSMIIAGAPEWTDYTVRVEMEIAERLAAGEAGVLVRATHPSYYPEQVRDSVRAYYIVLRGSRLYLEKLNYGSKRLAQADIDLPPDALLTLQIEAVGPVLRVYANGSPEPVIEYADPDAYMHGAVGLRANTGRVAFRNFSVRCGSCSVFARLKADGYTFWLSPHVSRYDIVLPFGAVHPPEIRTAEPDPDEPVDLLDPGARVEVVQASSIPGEARVRVVGSDGTALHEAVVAFTKLYTPVVHVDVPGFPNRRDGWAGEVSGHAPVAVEVNGPDELLQSVRITLSRIEANEAVDEREIYRGTAVPENLVLDTQELADGTYEIHVAVESVCGTKAGRSIRFAVRNRSEIIDDFLPPLEFFGTAVDRRKTVLQSDGWHHAADPAALFGDRDRLVRVHDTTEFLVWEAPRLIEAVATVYSLGEEGIGAIVFEISEDGETWRAAPHKAALVEQADDGWMKFELAAEAPPQTEPRFVRLTVREGVEPGALQLGQVRLVVPRLLQ